VHHSRQAQQQLAVNKPSLDSERLLCSRPSVCHRSPNNFSPAAVGALLNAALLPRHRMPDTEGRGGHVVPSMQQQRHTSSVGPRFGSRGYQVPVPTLYAAGIPRMGNRLPDCAVGSAGRQHGQQVPSVCGLMDAGVSQMDTGTSYRGVQWSAALPANCAVLQHSSVSSAASHWPLSQTPQQCPVVNWPPQSAWTGHQSAATGNERAVVSSGSVNRPPAWIIPQSTGARIEHTVVANNVNPWMSQQISSTANERTAVSGDVTAWTSQHSPGSVNDLAVVSGGNVNQLPIWAGQQSSASMNEHTVVSGGSGNRPQMWTSMPQFQLATVNETAARIPLINAATQNVNNMSQIYDGQAASRIPVPPQNRLNISAAIPAATRLCAVGIPGAVVSIPTPTWVPPVAQQSRTVVVPSCNSATAASQSGLQRAPLSTSHSPAVSLIRGGATGMMFVGSGQSSAAAVAASQSPSIVWRSRFDVQLPGANAVTQLSAEHVTPVTSSTSSVSQTVELAVGSSSASVVGSPPVVGDGSCLRNNTVGRVYQLPPPAAVTTTVAPMVQTSTEHAAASQQSLPAHLR